MYSVQKNWGVEPGNEATSTHFTKAAKMHKSYTFRVAAMQSSMKTWTAKGKKSAYNRSKIRHDDEPGARNIHPPIAMHCVSHVEVKVQFLGRTRYAHVHCNAGAAVKEKRGTW